MTKSIAPILEILSQVDEQLKNLTALLSKQKEVIRQTLAEADDTELGLQFYDKFRLIFWSCGVLQLPEKEYWIVRVIWYGANHEAEWTEIEDIVWRKNIRKTGKGVERHNICTRVKSANIFLRKEKCPYQIEAVYAQYNRRIKEIRGWRIVLSERK